MTNEQLVMSYYNGENGALAQLYEINKEYIRKLVKSAVKRYAGYISVKDHSKDLFQIASLEFIERIQKGGFDPQKGGLLTYLTPYLKARILEYIAQTSSLFQLDSKRFALTAKCRALRKKWRSNAEIAQELGIPERTVKQYLRYPFGHTAIVNGESHDEHCVSECILPAKERSAESIVYRKWCLRYTKELFEQLSAKDKWVLGSYYGVYGYEQLSSEEIGNLLTVSRDAVLKRVKSILCRLRKLYYQNSRLYVWCRAHRLVWDAIEE